ncbi:MAG: hypothetical protein UD936_10605 [Acutalibacteraceae bacterium]|nr:hypothetical protein [Acutalibacteraceae bacterium]
MSYNEYIANSNTAFGSGEYTTALKYAEMAIKEKPKETEGYICAGKSCMSLDRPNEAAQYFKKTIEIDKKNGNAYFLLGYSQALAGNTVEAIRSLTRALENDCEESVKGQIYKMMSMINTEQGDYKNALLNLEQAEQYIGVDYELLQQKAACYASLKDFRQTIFTLNQMKLIQPNIYTAYSLAFHIFMELGIYDEAEAELERAKDYAELNMSYYGDRVTYSIMKNPEKDTAENLPEKWKNTIKEINTALEKGKPVANEVFEMYLRASQLYVSMEEADNAIACLDATIDPIMSYNQKFSVLLNKERETEVLSIPDGLTLDEEHQLMQERWDKGEFEEVSQQMSQILYDIGDADPHEITEALQRYLSPVDVIPEKEEVDKEEYVLEGIFSINPIQKDLRNALYLSAYEIKKDYDNMLDKARELQSSDITSNQYTGMYYELKIGKYKNTENWEKKYRDRINFWTKRMLEDPTDYISASYRIRAYIDLEDFENAEKICSCLPAEVKEQLIAEIEKAKAK